MKMTNTTQLARLSAVVALLGIAMAQPTVVSATNCAESVCKDFTNAQGWQYKCCVHSAGGCKEYRRRIVTCPGGYEDYLYEWLKTEPDMDCFATSPWQGVCAIDPPAPGGGGT